MKIKHAHIGLQVVASEASDATVYEITELRWAGTQVVATLQDIDFKKSKPVVMEVCYLSIPTIQQLTA